METLSGLGSVSEDVTEEKVIVDSAAKDDEEARLAEGVELGRFQHSVGEFQA